MENNSDKQLRDKLNSTEFPFDQQAWDKMEGMLDGKKKRRGFFWWWTGGIAAALLFGMIGYELRGVVGEGKLEVRSTKLEVRNAKSEEKPKPKEQTPNGNNEKSQFENQKPDEGAEQLAVNSGAVKNNQKEQSLTTNTNPSKTGNKKSKIRNNKTQIAQNQQPVTGNQIAELKTQTPNNKRQTTASRHSLKKKTAPASLAALAGKETNNNEAILATNSYRNEVAMLTAASGKSAVEENISLNRKEASLLEYVSEKETPSFDKTKDADAIPKQKKKIFHYSIGVLGNITAATLGQKSNNSSFSKRPTIFYDRPSYMVGFTHDFLFVDRVAITNSILYSQTWFDVIQPKTVSFAKSPNYYNCKIQELTIPIGIKVYPVVKEHFRFYINTGIINHIKLREIFDYAGSPDTVVNATANFANQGFYPAQTDFSDTKVSDPMGQGLSSTSNSTKDFSINGAKRYYTSFYASAGFEFIPKKHFILFTEPLFYMTLQKIGVQDKRKYNVGLTGGFRYEF